MVRRVSTHSRAAALVVGWLAVAGAAGAVWMFLAHLGLEIAVRPLCRPPMEQMLDFINGT